MLLGLLVAMLPLAVASASPAAAEDKDPPQTQISGGPKDAITPGQPVTLTKNPTVRLSASEPSTFNCAINAKKVHCQEGATVLAHLKPGPQVFVAQAVDRAGNFDASPAVLTFYVPHNFKPGQGKDWKKVKSRSSYAGDYASTTKKGAVLRLGRLRGIREVRLIAPVGPRLGKVAVKIGRSPWMKVRLKAAKAQRLHVFELRGPDARAIRGKILVKALKVPPGGAVAVDAIVAR